MSPSLPQPQGPAVTGVPIASPPGGVRLSFVWIAVAVFALIAAGIAHFVTRSDTLAWAEAYADGLARLKTEARLTEALGTPDPTEEPKFDQTNPETAWLSFPVRGERGSGEVSIELKREGDRWAFRSGFVRLDGGRKVLFESGSRATLPPVPQSSVVLAAPQKGETTVPPPAPTPVPVVLNPNDALTVVETPAFPAGVSEQRAVLGVIPGAMQFDPKVLTLKAGAPTAILFINKACPLQHNLVILQPGTEEAYGRACDAMMAKDPAQALMKDYVPDDPEVSVNVIAKSGKLIGTGQNEVLRFTAPSVPGDYPFICTFPGHRLLMKGKLTGDSVARMPSAGASSKNKLTEPCISDTPRQHRSAEALFARRLRFH